MKPGTLSTSAPLRHHFVFMCSTGTSEGRRDILRAMQGVVESVHSLGDTAGERVGNHMDRTFRQAFRGPGTAVTDQYVRLVTGEPHPFGNIALVRDLFDANSALEAVTPLLREVAPAAVITTCAPSADVEAVLQENGFTDAGPMPAMAVDIDSLTATSLPRGYRFERLTSASMSQDWTHCLAVGYGLPTRLSDLFATDALGGLDLAEDAAIQWFAVYKEDRPVSVSMTFCLDGLAGVYCVATLPEERGKGLAAHVTAEPLRRLRSTGYRVGVLQASDAGFPVYLRLGFQHVGGLGFYLRMPEAS